MAGALSVRLAGMSDRAQWLALWQGWQDHMEGHVPDRVTESTWNRIVTPDSGLWSFMAFDGGEALGIAVVSRTPFAWTGDDILFLQDLFVTAEARGRGVGAALLKEVYAHGDAVGASQVFWMVDEHDPELQGFYARHGVRTPYHRYMRRGWPW